DEARLRRLRQGVRGGHPDPHHRRHHRHEPAADRREIPYRPADRHAVDHPQEPRVMETIHNAIGGRLVKSASTRNSPVFNPATGEQTAVLPLSTLDEIDAAVANAKAALPAWAATTPMKRARIMFKFKELLERHADELAREISKEHGKVHDDAMGELA